MRIAKTGKFLDSWVIDKTLFDFVSDGSCACCGLPYIFNPDGVKGLIEACTDIETDAAEDEINAKSPWPPEIREQVWGDRVRLRLKMKQQMKNYKAFLTEYSLEDIKEFCLLKDNVQIMRKIFQMPRMMIMEEIKEYNIHSAYSNVMAAVTEQVAKFPQTLYEDDGRCQEEIDFERNLIFSRRGAGFTLKLFQKCDGEIIMNEDILDSFLNYMSKLGGPKLLVRKLIRGNEFNNDGTDEGDDLKDDDENEVPDKSSGGFQGDRRLIRLLVARYWARGIIEKYAESLKETNGNLQEISRNLQSTSIK